MEGERVFENEIIYWVKTKLLRHFNYIIDFLLNMNNSCKTSVHKVVRKKIKLFPYKIQIVQSLEDPDSEKRESFARTVMDLINTDATFPFFSLGICKKLRV